MIMIKDCWIEGGYSSEDHLNDDITDYIGEKFRTVGEARKSIFTRSVESGCNSTKSPIGLEVQFEDGSTKRC